MTSLSTSVLISGGERDYSTWQAFHIAWAMLSNPAGHFLPELYHSTRLNQPRSPTCGSSVPPWRRWATHHSSSHTHLNAIHFSSHPQQQNRHGSPNAWTKKVSVPRLLSS